MTRDEAIETASECGINYRVVDALVALGLLKLDEPKTVGQRIEDATHKNCFRDGMQNVVVMSGDYILRILDDAGLRVVDK